MHRDTYKKINCNRRFEYVDLSQMLDDTYKAENKHAREVATFDFRLALFSILWIPYALAKYIAGKLWKK